MVCFQQGLRLGTQHVFTEGKVHIIQLCEVYEVEWVFTRAVWKNEIFKNLFSSSDFGCLSKKQTTSIQKLILKLPWFLWEEKNVRFKIDWPMRKSEEKNCKKIAKGSASRLCFFCKILWRTPNGTMYGGLCYALPKNCHKI